MKAQPFMQSLLWCCTSCGFMRAGGQPVMECPICEAYKSAFIDSPQQIEAQLLDTYGEGNTNTADARRERLTLLRASGHLSHYRVRGRSTKAVHQPTESRRYT